jgi:prevent-host-death family protein
VLGRETNLLNLATDIQSLTSFRRSSGDFMRHLKKSKRPIVLTVNGKAAAVVQDVKAYQRLLDIASRTDAEDGTLQRQDDARKGKIRLPEDSARTHPVWLIEGDLSRADAYQTPSSFSR